MKYMFPALRITLLAAAAMALGGCYLQKAPDYAAIHAAPPPPALKGALILSTNEPFYHARVEDGYIDLSGLDVESVRLKASGIVNFANGRRWTGGKGRDQVTVQILEEPCVDSMSGAPFPFSGVLIVGKTTVHGCARPADAPLPSPVP